MKLVMNKLLTIILLLAIGSCTLENKKMVCYKRPLTQKEQVFFDSLLLKFNMDSVDVNRVDFSKCDENGIYIVTFSYCDKQFVSQRDSIQMWSKQIVCDLHTKILSKKVACVTTEYQIRFEGKEKFYPKTHDITLKVKPTAYTCIKKFDIEAYTGVIYKGSYFGKSFSREDKKPTVDSLKISCYLTSDGEDPLK